jgi:hypothetical protein
MFELLPKSTETCIGFKISGEITAADYDALLPKLDEAIAAHGKINLLVLVEDFDFSGFEAAKKDFQFGTHQYHQVEKAAFVSDKKWIERLVKIMDPFTRRTDEKIFEPEQLDAAWAWVLAEDST